MKTFISVITIFAGILVVGCTPAYHASSSAMNADREAITKMMDRGLMAIRAGDLETYFNLFEEDAIWIPPESGADVEKETMQEALRRALVVYDFRDLEARTDEVLIDRNLAVVRVSSRGLRPKDVHHVELFIRHMYILRRQDDGSWKVARYMWIGSGGEQFAPPSE